MSATNNQQQMSNNLALNRTDSGLNGSRNSHGSPKAAAHSPYAQQVLHASDMLEKPSTQPMTGGNGYYGCSSNSSNSDSGERESMEYGSSTTPTYPNYQQGYNQQQQQLQQQQYSPYQQPAAGGSYPGSPYHPPRQGSGPNTPSRHNSYHQMLPAAMSQSQNNTQQQQQQQQQQQGSYANAAPPPPPSYVQATVTAAREWNNTPPQQPDSHEGTPLNRRNSNSNSFNNSQNNSQNNRSSPKNTQQHQRKNSSPQPTVEGCPEGAYHSPLFGKCEWIQPPPVPQVELQTPAFPCYRLFLGQIRFETTPAEVKWIVEYVTGVQALKVETRGIGCFLAYFGAYDDMVAVQGLHKRILFDHTGIWFARTDEQAQQMQDYVRAALGRIGRGFRLPKDMMVVEEEKLQRALPIPSAPPQYNVNTPTFSSFHGGAPASTPSSGAPQQHLRAQRTNSGPQEGFSQIPEYSSNGQ